MAKFKLGDVVQQVVVEPVRGLIVDYSLDKTNGEVQYQVAWTDKDEKGEEHIHSKFFTAEQLELDEEATAAAKKEAAAEVDATVEEKK